MKRILVLSFITNDRPGLISDISEIIAEFKGNWMESRLSHLAGKFAGILQISVPAENIKPLEAALINLQGEEVSWLLESMGNQTSAIKLADQITLDLVGNDRPGIVHDVTEILSDLDLNVEDMASEFSDAPMSSDKLFRATIQLSSANPIDDNQIEDKLESLANELMIEIRRETD